MIIKQGGDQVSEKKDSDWINRVETGDYSVIDEGEIGREDSLLNQYRVKTLEIPLDTMQKLLMAETNMEE